MEKEPKIIAVEIAGPIADVGAAACKAMPPGRRYRYKRAIKYTLDDGREIESSEHAATKPKLAERFESTQKKIANGELFAWFSDGQFAGTTWKAYIGPR